MSAEAPHLSSTDQILRLRAAWRVAHQEHKSAECDRLWFAAVEISREVLEESDPALLEKIPIRLNERLARDGREWERLIVQVATSEKAAFGAIEYEIEVEQASHFHVRLEQELAFLQGGILFTESAALDAYREGRWSGRTYCFFPDTYRNWSLSPLESFTGLVGPPRITKLT